MDRLTEKQIEALRALSKRDASPWDFGSTTVNRLCGAGYAERVIVVGPSTLYSSRATMLRITPAGLARLAAV